jgi:hypothetical protein
MAFNPKFMEQKMYSKQLPFSLRSLMILLTVFLFAGCSSGADIRSDHDPAADFGGYKTYNFLDGAGPDHGNYQSFFSKYMVAAITIEMENRGYVKAQKPDLLVNFNAVLNDKTKVTTSPSMNSGYYGYRGAGYGGYGGYGGWGGYGYGTDTHVSQYTEGTFNIDLIDAERHQLVWEAVGVGRITDKFTENLEQTVMQGVPVFFQNYPFVAGDPNPVTGN